MVTIMQIITSHIHLNYSNVADLFKYLNKSIFICPNNLSIL